MSRRYEGEACRNCKCTEGITEPRCPVAAKVEIDEDSKQVDLAMEPVE